MNIRGRKIAKYIILILIILFLIWNIVWAVNFYCYHKTTEGYEKSPVSYIKSGKDYTYTVVKPHYLSFTGNFAITNNKALSLIIWPGIFFKGDSEYGIGIYDHRSEETYRFYVDKNLKYLEDKNDVYSDLEEKRIKKLLKKYEGNLEKMLQLANLEWV